MSPSDATDSPSRRRRAGEAPRPRGPSADDPGVLGSLPNTRPQRPSARRAAARTAKTSPEPAEPPVPPQGFEAEEQIEPGRPVQPPSGPELAASVADLFGELAQAGLSTGGRLLGDAFKRLTGG
ncbi:MAG: hypothetical protein ACRDLF_07790 [Solirubrobacteraceae bacterium]